jgi:FkbM family methyltransferase
MRHTHILRHFIGKKLGPLLPDRGWDQIMRFITGKIPTSLPDVEETNLKGFPLRIRYNPHEYIGYSFHFRQTYSYNTLKLISQFLRPNMSFIDIGANYGIFTLVAAWTINQIGSKSKCYSFEPQPNLYNAIQENIKLNQLENIVVFNCALSDKSGELNIRFPNKYNLGEAALVINENEEDKLPSIKVAVKTLSDVLGDELHNQQNSNESFAMKIDVEGCEYNVLLGAERLFNNRKPEFILLECDDRMLHRFGSSAKSLVELLHSYQFELFALVRNRIVGMKWVPFENIDALMRNYHFYREFLAISIDTPTWTKIMTM